MQRNRLSTCAAGVYLGAAALLLASLLTPTDAAVLRKSVRQGAQKKASGIRKGLIVVGERHRNASADEDYDYQSDFTGVVKGQVFDVSSKEAQWRRLCPLLLCGLEHMRFKVSGLTLNAFALDQDPLLPLSNVPPSCGYNMPKNPFGLILNVPYQGCHIVHEDSFHSLPLVWNGLSVTLKCPKDQQSTTTAPPQDPTVPPVDSGFLSFLQMLLNQLQQISNIPAPSQDPEIWNTFFSYLLQLLQNQDQSSTPAPPQDPTLSNDYYLYLLQLLQTQHQATNPQDPALWNAYFSYLLQLFQNQPQSTTPAPPLDPALGNGYFYYLLQLLQNQAQSTTPAPTPDPALYAYFHYLLQMHQNQAQTTTPAPTQDPALGNTYFYYLLQLLQNQDQTTTPAPAQDPVLWNAYITQLIQLLQNQGQPTSSPLPYDPALWTSFCSYLFQRLHGQVQSPALAPQDPQMPPQYLYQGQGLESLAFATPPPPAVPQNPLQQNPWIFGLQTAAPTTPLANPQQGQVPVWHQQGQVPVWHQQG